MPNSEIEIAGEVSAGDFMLEKEAALEEFSQNLDIKGFRKGKTPKDVILKNVNQKTLLERMAIMALEKHYPKIIEEDNIKPIGRPEIIITKMAENNPLGFKIKTAVMPEIKLPDYKSAAKEVLNKKNEKDKIRINILDKILESVKIDAPRVLVEGEKNQMMGEMKNYIAGTGLKWENYLQHIKKTEEELKKDWEENAIKRVKYGLVLNEMAEKEKIEVSEEELNQETEKIILRQASTGQNTNREKLKPYIYGALRNEKLFQLLENAK